MNQKNANGERHGPFETYFKNSQLAWKGNFLNGLFHGPFESYHDNGQLRWKCNYVNGLAHGLYEGYFSNGKLCSKGFSQNHQRIGFWLEGYSDGIIIKQFYL